MSTDEKPKLKYIYDLPYRDRHDLCRILDIHDEWKSLGGHMEFNTLEIQELEHLERRGKSPTDELLTKWSQQNHTVQELFVLLSRIQHYQAMTILKPFVDPKFHALIKEGEASMTRLMKVQRHSEDLQRTGSTLRKVTPMSSNTSTATNNAIRGAAGHCANDKMLMYGEHNLNVIEVGKENVHSSVSQRKIQNVRNTLSLEDNIHVEESAPPSPNAGGPAASPSPNSNTNVKNPLAALPPSSSSQRKLSGVSVASSVSDCALPNQDYKEMEIATNGWDRRNILGRGGFGTVYRGTWKNTQVAIKRLELPKGETQESQEMQIQQSMNELVFLHSFRHDNILQLYGFSVGGEHPCLVYQYMENGSLEVRLMSRKGATPLTWSQRYNIAKGTARGLQYLHTIQKQPLIHGDIKSANILLDSNFEPRIGDFGLARQGPQNQYTHLKVSRIHGTKPYLPDEFLRSNKLSTKVDTYSYGVVLFELVTGQRAYDAFRQNKFLKDEVMSYPEEWTAFLVDQKVGLSDQQSQNTVLCLLMLGKRCVAKIAKERPEMEAVLKELDNPSKELVDAVLAKSRAIFSPLQLQAYYDQLKHQMPSVHPLPNSHAGSSGHPGGISPPVSGIPGNAHPGNILPAVAPQGSSSIRPMGPLGLISGQGNSIVPIQSPYPVFVKHSSLEEGRSVPNSPPVLPTISVMPATGSTTTTTTTSTHSSASEISSDYSSRESQIPSGAAPKEWVDVREPPPGPEVLPLLSVLGIKDTSVNSTSHGGTVTSSSYSDDTAQHAEPVLSQFSYNPPR